MSKHTCIFILVIALLVVLLGGTTVSADVVGYWPFEDGKGDIAKDKSGNGHDGLITGAKWVDNGKFGKALDFDGESHVDIPESDTTKRWESFTMMAWIYPTAFNGDWERIIDCYLPPNAGFWTCIRQDGRIDWGLLPPEVYYDTNGKVELNNWTHVAFVWDLAGNLKGEFVVYFNGVIDDVKDSYNDAITTPAPIRIGGRTQFDPNPTEWWVGYIDEVVIFNNALEVEEIEQAVKGQIPGIAAVQHGDKLILTWGEMKNKY